MPNKMKCCLCFRWTAGCRQLSSSTHDWFHKLLHEKGTSFDKENLFLCRRCVHRYYDLKAKFNEESTEDLMEIPDDSFQESEENELRLDNVLFAGSGHKFCVICREEVRAGMVTMPKAARVDLLIMHSMYAPSGVRCCSEHLFNDRYLKPDLAIVMDNRRLLSTTFSSETMIEAFNDLLSLLQAARDAPRLDFTDPSLNDEDYLAWTGWTKEQFDDMFGSVSPFLRSSSNRHMRNALAIFWIKMKTNLSFRQIGSIFNVPGDGENRRKRMADAFDAVRKALMENFVPLHLGAQHLSREEAIENNTSFSVEFFGNNVTIIWDGTYIYMGKSSSNQINRKTYSGQK